MIKKGCHDFQITFDFSEGELCRLSTSLSDPYLSESSGQDLVEMAGDKLGCSGWPAVSNMFHCSLIVLHNDVQGLPSCPLNQVVVTSVESNKSSLHMLK